MSVRTMAAVWAGSTHSGTELLMLLAIADFADDDGRAYPAVPTLARKCRMSPRNVNHLLPRLTSSGELVIKAGQGPNRTNLYHINLNALERVKQPSGVKNSSGMKCASGVKNSSPEAGFLKHLKPASDKPSENHQCIGARSARPGAADRGSRLPADWTLPDDWRVWCEQNRQDLNPQETADAFRDYWFGTPGAKGRKADWFATWRNWCRNQRQQATQRMAMPDTGLSGTDEQFFPQGAA